MFSVIVIVAIVTSLMAPFALRYTVSRVKLDDDELERLRLEAALESSFLGEIKRVLVPIRLGQGDVGSTRELQISILNRLAALQDMTITMLAVVPSGQKSEASQQLEELSQRLPGARVMVRVVTGDDPVTSILAEAERDYDLMVLGTPTVGVVPDNLFGPMIDDLVKLSPCPSMLVRGVPQEGFTRRILVPTNGTAASRRAAELAFAIADEDTVVEGLHVVTPSAVSAGRGLSAEVTAELEVVGDAMGKSPVAKVRHHGSAEAGILAYIEETQPDLLILGTEVRAGTTRLHLGPRVEHLVTSAPCPVVVLNG
jgi:nucleotide-binding universal stress UspA family protein